MHYNFKKLQHVFMERFSDKLSVLITPVLALHDDDITRMDCHVIHDHRWTLKVFQSDDVARLESCFDR